MMNRVYVQSTQLGPQEPVRQKDPVHFRSLMLILFICSMIVIGILSYIWRGVEIIRIGYKMRAVYYQQTVLQEQRQKLILERAALRSLKRIERIASSDLNLVRPNPEQVIILPASRATENKAESDVQQNLPN